MIQHCFAETLVLNNGSRLNGRIGELSDDIVKFYSDQYRTISMATIADAIPDEGISDAERKKQESVINRLKLGINSERHILDQFTLKVQKLLYNEEFIKLDKLAKDLRANKTRNKHGTWMLAKFYVAIKLDLKKHDKLAFDQRLLVIQRWKNATSSLASKISEVAVMRDYGWAIRGNGYMSTVSEKAKKEFRRLMNESLVKAESIRKTSHEDPMLYAYSITLHKVLGHDKSKILRLVEEADKHHAGFLTIYDTVLDSLAPKWGGSLAEIKQFIDNTTSKDVNASSGELYYYLVRHVSKHINDADKLIALIEWPKLERSYKHFSQLYPTNDGHLFLMAKISCALNIETSCKYYFNESTQQWNHFANKMWDSKIQMQSYLRWKEKNTSALATLMKALPLATSELESSANLEQFVKSGGDINFKNIKGKTLLNTSIENNDIQTLESLISLGVDINNLNQKGESNLHLASKNPSILPLLILLKNSVKTKVATRPYKETPIHYSASRGYTQHVLALLDSDPDLLDIPNSLGNTVLHLAVINGHQDLLAALLRANVNVDQLTRAKDSVLHLAAKNRHMDIAKKLMEEGVDINLINGYNQTALSIAKEEGILELIQLLESHNANDSEIHILKSSLRQAEQLMEKVQKLLNATDYKEAKKLIKEALVLNPRSSFAYHNLSFINMYYEKDYIKSAQNIDKTLELNPNRVEAYYQAGRTYHMLKRPDKYVDFFNDYIAMAPDTYNTRDLLNKYQHLLTHKKSSNSKRKNKAGYKLQQTDFLMDGALAMLSILVLAFIWLRYKRRTNIVN